MILRRRRRETRRMRIFRPTITMSVEMDILRSFDMFGMQPKYFRASPFFSLLFGVFLLYVSTIFLAILLIVFSMWI